MAQYTLEVAQQHLDSWLAAELALSTGQSYTIGNRSLTRANVKEVMDQIRYWSVQVAACKREELGLPAKRRVRRYLPLDL
jgi:outer membrane PBP1 activator LpoA protein